MSKVKEFRDESGEAVGWSFRCPGCKGEHIVHTTKKNHCNAQWTFNGDMEKPSFSPSLNQRIGPFPQGAKRQGLDWSGRIDVCHVTVTDGLCHFHGDCTHEFANQSLPIPDAVNFGD